MEIVKNTRGKKGKRVGSERLDRMNKKINEKERELRRLRLLKESGDNDSRPFEYKIRLDEERVERKGKRMKVLKES